MLGAIRLVGRVAAVPMDSPRRRAAHRSPSSGLATRSFWSSSWCCLRSPSVLALAETSLVRTSRAKALALEDDHHRGARQLVRLVEHPETFLNGVLLMVLVCQLVTATLVGLLAEHWFGNWGVFVALVFEIVVIFVLAEAIPKNYAVRNPDSSALFSAPFVTVVVRFWPVRMLSNGLVWLAEKLGGGPTGAATVSESELLALADVATEEDVIEHSERVLIHSIIEFGDTVVREVMVPRPDMRAVEASMSVSDALGVAMDVGFSRLPVYADNVDDVVGIAYAKDLIRLERSHAGRRARRRPRARRALRPRDQARGEPDPRDAGAHLPPSDRRGRVRRNRRARHARGPDRGAGRRDRRRVRRGGAPGEAARGRRGVRVCAPRASTSSGELLDTELPTGVWDTVGGLVFDLLGHVPEQGESVRGRRAATRGRARGGQPDRTGQGQGQARGGYGARTGADRGDDRAAIRRLAG